MLFILCYIVSLESYSNGKSNDLWKEIHKKPEVQCFRIFPFQFADIHE